MFVAVLVECMLLALLSWVWEFPAVIIVVYIRVWVKFPKISWNFLVIFIFSLTHVIDHVHIPRHTMLKKKYMKKISQFWVGKIRKCQKYRSEIFHTVVFSHDFVYAQVLIGACVVLYFVPVSLLLYFYVLSRFMNGFRRGRWKKLLRKCALRHISESRIEVGGKSISD